MIKNKFTKKQKLASFLASSAIIIGLCIGIYSLLSKPVEAAWWDDVWQYRQKTTITNNGSAQTDYQVSITLDTDGLVTDGKLQSDCDDIRVVDNIGNLLPIWIEPTTCNGNSTLIWTKIPNINAGTSTLYIYYGNPNASSVSAVDKVFIRDIAQVQGAWNLDEASSTRADSSGNGYTLTDNATVGSTTGQYGNAARFVRTSSEYLSRADNDNLSVNHQSFTVAAWIRLTTTGNSMSIISKQHNGGAGEYRIDYVTGSSVLNAYVFDSSDTLIGSISNPTVLSSGVWYHIVFGFDLGINKMFLYVDGTEASAANQVNGIIPNSTDEFRLGQANGGTFFDGDLDEVKFYKAAIRDLAIINDLKNTSYLGYFTANYVNHELLRKYVASNAPTSGTPASEEKSNGPATYWRFDEGADNMCSGGANDTCNSIGNSGFDGAFGATTAAPTWKTEELCLLKGCIYTDGSNDVVSDTTFASFSGDLSVSLWVKGYNQSSGNRFFDLAQAASGGLSIFMDATGAINVDNTGGPTSELNSASGFGDNAWHHVVVTRSGTNYTLYVDGIPYASSGGTAPTYTRVFMGTNATSTNFYKGFLDEFKVYNYLLSSSQIKSEFAGRGSNSFASATIGNNGINTSVLSDGLAGYWKLDEASGNATDYSGNGTTLTDVATVARVAGKYANGGDFEKDNSEYLYAADNAVLSITGDLTVSAWVKKESSGVFQYWIAKKDNLGRDSYAIGVNNTDKFRLVLYDSSDVLSDTVSNETISDGVWYHFAGTYNQAARSTAIYINGKLAGSTHSGTVPTALEDNDGRFHIGAHESQGTVNALTDGIIDEARVYNRTLNPKEIEALYNWAPGPLAYYKMDDNSWTNDCSTDTVFDSSGNGLMLDSCPNGTGPITPAQGKFGNSADFDGSTQYFQSASTTFEFANQVTLAAWVNVANPTDTSTDKHFVDKTNNNAGYGLLHASNSLIPKFKIGNGSSNVTLNGASAISENTWVHLAGTFDGTNLTIYINGVFSSTTTHTTMAAPTAQNFRIGTRSTSSHNFVDGRIDEVKVYNYARSAKQVVEDMNGGHPIGGSPVSSALGYWKLDEAQGQTLNDSGFAVNNGTRGASSAVSTDDPPWLTGSSCKINSCLDFDGSADFVDLGTNSISPNLASATGITVSLWANTDTFPADGQRERMFNVYMGEDSTAISLSWFDDAGEFEAGGRSQTGDSFQTARYAFAGTGGWHHYAAIYDFPNDKIYIFIDGTLRTVGSVTFGASTFTPGTPTTYNDGFGSADGAGPFFDGKLDQIKIYNSILTADEIKLDYNNGSSVAFGGVLGTQDNEGFGGNAPIGHWSMNENTDNSCTGGTNDVCDTSGTGIDGAKTNMSATNWVQGKVGTALDFDGSDDYISLGTSDTYNLTGNLTIEAWIKPDTYGTGNNGRIFERRAASSGYFLHINNSGQICFLAVTVVAACSNSSVFTLGQWAHVAFTRSGTTGTFYVNGVQQGTATVSSIVSSSGSNAYIGTEISPDDRDFDGIIDEVKLYDYARSAAQIVYSYNRGGPIAWYKFDECQGSTAYDAAATATGLASGNNGTITPGAGSNTSTGTCSSGTGSEMWNDGTTGKRNASLGFDGDDDYVTMGDPTSGILDFADGQDFSISAWINAANFSASQTIVAKKTGNGAGAGGYLLTLTAGQKLNAYVSDTTDQYFKPSINNLSANTWYHVVFVFDEDSSVNSRFWVNGLAEDGTSTGTIGDVGSVANSQPFVVGAESDFGQPFEGKIDEVRVYNFALQANQIKQIYNNGAVFFGPETGSP